MHLAGNPHYGFFRDELYFIICGFPRAYSGNVVIDISGECGAAQHIFATSRLAARFDGPWVISYEHDIPIMVCTGIKVPLANLWPRLKEYI